MTPTQVAVNSAAILAAAARLEHAGYEGDAAAFVESLLLNALADGYRKLPPPPALVGPSSTEAGRARARELFEETRRNALHPDDGKA